MSVPVSAELKRLRALKRYAILDTSPEAPFDRLAGLAARLFSAPMAVISFVDEERQWFKAACGFDISETSRDLSFCHQTILAPRVLVVPDARSDQRFATNPLVAGHPWVVFYAGAPLLTPDGHSIGTLAVLDTKPRPDLAPPERATLSDLAAEVVDQLELRLARLERAGRPTARLAAAASPNDESLEQKEALRRSEERYRVLVELSPDAIVVHRDNRVLYVNNAAAELYGARTPEDLVDRPAMHFVHPDYHAVVSERIEKLQRLGIPAPMLDEKHIRLDGTQIDVEVVSIAFEHEGRPAVQAVIRDIGQRKRAERALRESEMQFRAVFDGSLDAMCILDENWCFLDVNPAAHQLFGSSHEGIISRPLDAFCHPRDAERVRDVLYRAVDQIEQRGTMRWMRRDGTHLDVEYGIRPNFLPGRHLAIVRDVTEQLRLEQQFRQAQKMEAIGRLAGGVAHDFNNLLTIISGYCQMALDELENIDTLRANIEEIQKAGERAAGLTRQLLAFSRNQVLRLHVLDLNSVIADTEKMLRRLIGEDVELITSLETELGRVKADAGQFEQVMLNLAVNARDAMPHGGKLLIETANVDFDDRLDHRRMPLPPGPYVTVSVSDTGTGMDQETVSHIFEPFYTTKEKGQGTGLGLSTVYGIVKQSGGDVRVFTEPGRGTTFRIYLPRVTEEGEPAAASQPPAAALRGSETVLLVEDETDVRILMSEILRGRGYKVIEASNGEEALLKCEQFPGNIALMITDAVMPGLSGRELAMRLQPLRPGMRVLHISGYTDRALAHGSEDEPFNFIQKPFTPQILAAKVRDVLDTSDQ